MLFLFCSSFIFLSLLCTPLRAMDDQDAPKKTLGQKLCTIANKARLATLFRSAQKARFVPDNDNIVNEVAWNPQGTHLAVARETPIVLNMNDQSIAYSARLIADQIAWNSAGKLLAMTSEKKCTIFDLTQKINPQLPALSESDSSYFSVGWSPSEENVFICASEKNITKYSIAEDGSVHAVSSFVLPQFWLGRPIKVDWGETLAVAYQGGIFCANNGDQFTQIPYQANSPVCTAMKQHPFKNVIACAFLSHPFAKRYESQLVLCCQQDNKQFVPAKTVALKRIAFDLSFSHDGRLLSAANDNRITTFDSNTLEELHSHALRFAICFTAQWHPQKFQLAFGNNEELFITQEPITSEEK